MMPEFSPDGRVGGAVCRSGTGLAVPQVRSTMPEGFDKFEALLKEWSRRDFLRRMGATAAFAGFMAGGVEFLDACGNGGGSSGQQAPQGKKGGHVVEGNFTDIS